MAGKKPIDAYMLNGKERSHAADYKVSFKEQAPGNINVKIVSYVEPNRGEILDSNIRVGESTSDITDINGNKIFTKTDEGHGGKVHGYEGRKRWVKSLIRNDYEYESPDEEDKKNLSPTGNEWTYKIDFGGFGSVYQMVGKKKLKHTGPDWFRVFPSIPGHDNEDIVSFMERPKYIEVKKHNYHDLGPIKEATMGSKWISDHKVVKHLFNLVGNLPLGRFNSGFDATLHNGDDVAQLLSARRDYFNWKEILFKIPTTYVTALDGKVRYKLGIDSTYLGVAEYHPSYLKRKLIDEGIKSTSVQFPGRHNALNKWAPHVKKIYIEEINDVGDPTGHSAELVFDTNRTYRDFVCDINLIKPETVLCDFGNLVSPENGNLFWKQLNDNWDWKEYLSKEEKTFLDWRDDVSLTHNDAKKRIIVNKKLQPNESLGYFEAKKDHLYFKNEDDVKIKVGMLDAETDIVYGGGIEPIARIVIQKNLLRKKYLRNLSTKERDLADYSMYVTFSEAHKNDGALISKNVIGTLVNMQKELNLGPDFVENFNADDQLPLEPTFDMLHAILCSDSKTCMYEGHNLRPSIAPTLAMEENMSPDFVIALKQIMSETVTDADVNKYMSFFGKPVAKKKTAIPANTL